MREYRAFIFDCDGTILDTLPDLAETTNKTLSDLGYPTHTNEEIRTYIGDGAKRLIYLSLPAGTSEYEQQRAFQYWCDVYVDLGFKHSEYYPEMVETLQRLKKRGCKLAVLSNKIDSATKLVVDQYYPGVFDIVYGERKGIPRKPDPTGLVALVDELGFDPSQAVYVGDAVTDVEVAHRAGTVAVAASWGYTDDELLLAANPDMLAKSATDILKLL